MDSNWNTAIRRGAVSGSLAGVLSVAALAALGKRDSGSALAPINSVSHWLYGDRAKLQEGASARYTLPGIVTHIGSALFWGVLFERFAGRFLDRRRTVTTLEAAAAATAVAYVTDYKLVPYRLQPGFEARLTGPSLGAVYLAIGAGLALGAMLSRR